MHWLTERLHVQVVQELLIKRLRVFLLMLRQSQVEIKTRISDIIIIYLNRCSKSFCTLIFLLETVKAGGGVIDCLNRKKEFLLKSLQ